ncbi:MAG: hypothetical protein U5R48_12345 [Gammaproteobacteria bacterium]|nr:hypothetical protein [Gammaproteobacteria bacterium]
MWISKRPSRTRSTWAHGYSTAPNSTSNEQQIGAILQRPGQPSREHLFLISKVWNTNHAPEHHGGLQTREALHVDTLDSYLLPTIPMPGHTRPGWIT